MNDQDLSLDTLKARGLALHVAVYALYDTIKTTKHMVGERRGTRDIFRQFDAMRALVDTIHSEASEEELTLYDAARTVEALRETLDAVINSADSAYQDGWQAALDQILETVPLDSRELVAWLLHVLQTDTAYREPVWDRIMELIRDARHYLEENNEA